MPKSFNSYRFRSSAIALATVLAAAAPAMAQDAPAEDSD